MSQELICGSLVPVKMPVCFVLGSSSSEKLKAPHREETGRLMLDRGRIRPVLNVPPEPGQAAAASQQPLVGRLLIPDAGADVPVLARLFLVAEGAAPHVVFEPAP